MIRKVNHKCKPKRNVTGSLTNYLRTREILCCLPDISHNKFTTKKKYKSTYDKYTVLLFVLFGSKSESYEGAS